MEIQIRPATHDDRPYVERCMVFCDSTFGNGLSPDRPLKGVLELIDSPNAVVFIAERNGSAIGFAGGYKYNGAWHLR